MNISVKDSMLLLNNIEGGNEKYAFYIINLKNNQVTTVSKPDKKVAIAYPLSKLLALYEKSKLKDGFKMNPELVCKPTEQIKDEYGIKMTKYTGEDKLQKISFWLANSEFDFNQLIPFLRLIGCWNDAQLPKGTIMEAEASGKISKHTSTVLMTFKKEFIDDKIFDVPPHYLKKNFVKLMEEEKGNKDLNLIVRSFTEF